VACGSANWFHSKYSLTDGVTVGWYRKLYYLNYLGGASAIFWEQGLRNQFMQPGNHPIELSPFGRATADFLDFVERVPDRGEPWTPVALYLGAGHGYGQTMFHARAFDVFEETPEDLELRELFGLLWWPAPILEGQPAAPDVQSLPNGVFGNIFDVLVDDGRFDGYSVVWAAAGARLTKMEAWLRRGGTLVVDPDGARQLDPKVSGLHLADKTRRASQWRMGGAAEESVPFDREEVELRGAQVVATAEGAPLVTRQTVGSGAVITILVPHLIGLDERAHPVVARVAAGLFNELAPVEVRPRGQIQYQLNRTKKGWLVTLINSGGVDKTQNGLPRVDRRAAVDVELGLRVPVATARELTQPRPLTVADQTVKLRVEPGDVQVVELR